MQNTNTSYIYRKRQRGTNDFLYTSKSHPGSSCSLEDRPYLIMDESMAEMTGEKNAWVLSETTKNDPSLMWLQLTSKFHAGGPICVVYVWA